MASSRITPEQRVTELEDLLQDRDRLAELLADAEQRTAQIPELELRIEALQHALEQAHEVAADAHRQLGQLDTTRMYLRRGLRHVRPLIGLLKKVRRRLRER